MTSKEWLSVMEQAENYNPAMTPLIIKYGELLLSENPPPSPSVEVSGGLEGQSIEAIELLKEYEQWEADLISDNAMWWPNVPKDRISGKTYDKMLELQAKRNQILKSLSSIKPEEGSFVDGKKYVLDADFNNASVVTLVSHGDIMCRVKDEANEWDVMLNRLSFIIKK